MPQHVSRSARLALAAVLGLAVAGAAGWLRAAAIARDLRTARDLHGGPYVGSVACARCHAEHAASWRRTFHRSMTRDASADTVLGDFSGRTLDYLGMRARMSRTSDGAFLIEVRDRRGALAKRWRIERTVGSHRYQQYLAREGDHLVRLPIAWHVEERRFFHMNGAFLTPDPEPDACGAGYDAPACRAAWERHVVRWNDNCVFCHNVAPNPGLDETTGRFRTEVAELGVACEACHGPGGEHVRINASPLRRYALHLGDARDPTIVSPARLSPERSADVCGRCHGQRITDDVSRFLRAGDPFVAGDDLALYSAPLWRDTPLAGDDDAFRERFWADGTARLTAYEYQGLLQSPCSERGELTCTSCHGMHEGDPSGQLRPLLTGDRVCTRCHEELARPAALTRHAHHAASGKGARCVGCHMPRIVYGLVSVHVSHRIESPDPARDAALARPDAGTGCHADETRAWAARAFAGMCRLRVRRADPEPGPAEGLRALFGGDPIERSVAAASLGRVDVSLSAERRRARLGALLSAMSNDEYPAVRRIAWHSAAALAPDAPWEPFEATATPASRARALAAARRVLRDVIDPSPALVASLRARARAADISIGE